MDGRILIIDASSYERQKIRHVLEKADSLEIMEAQNIGQLRLLFEKPGGFSLILMDIEFPDQAGGFEVLDFLRENDALRETPVIIVTKLDKSETKAGALKYNVRDYIVKPYQIKRLESSIKAVVGQLDEFHYDTSGMAEIRMTFDQYVSREIRYSTRVGTPLSFILITTLNLKDGEPPVGTSSLRSDTIFSIASEKARTSLRLTDTLVINKERDILILLPNTDEAGASQVCEKIKGQIIQELKRFDAEKNEYLYPVHVTCPADGEDFQALMKSAFMKVSNKEMLEKIVSIPADKLKYADKSYSRYRRWF